jgi:hypothetical protein
MTPFEQTVRALRRFQSFVLTGVDPAGYPISLRCQPQVDSDTMVLRVTAPAWFDVRPGPASLMSHSHDEQLWNLQGFLARGTLERTGDTLAFRPTSFAVNAGGGPLDVLRLMRDTRRAAAAYLRRRNLARPRIPWDKVEAAKKLANRGRSTGS